MFMQVKGMNIAPASAAIVMAIGIFLLGAIEAFPSVDALLGKSFAFLLFLIAALVYLLLFFRYGKRTAFQALNSHSLLAFTIGTWIAGLSVLGNVLHKYYPSLLWFIEVIAIANSSLLLFFLFIASYHFRRLWCDNSLPPVHGVILLSTVSVQSVVILLQQTWGLPIYLAGALILLGLFFYVISILLILRRYLQKTWTLSEDWTNTNCIIHGALSITGLAMLTTMAMDQAIITGLWWLTFALLIFVEFIEILRAIQRLHKYSWQKAFLTYEVTQWSRNFTFGMFFAFTYGLAQLTATDGQGLTSQIQGLVLPVWAWLVLIFLLIQSLIFLWSKLKDALAYL